MTEPERQLVIGGVSRDALREALAAQGVALNSYAEMLLEHSAFDDRTEQTVHVTRRSVAELGLPEGGTLPQILDATVAAGLRPCPLRTGPFLRLAMTEQEQAPDAVLSAGRVPTGALHVLSEPLSADHEVPKGFYLRVVDGTVWLRGYRCDDEYVLPPESQLVLRVPEAGEGA
ncbi:MULTISPECIES: hypothetical protein [Brachybacterium]|uniref:hypothetical protein n=1 Tax=Brachybacterium TaxID=43668 RepID=UPI003FD0CD44